MSRRLGIHVLLCIAIILVAGACHADKVELVVGGDALAAIVVGHDASAVESHAANELQKYIKQMTGAELPIISELDQGTDYHLKTDKYANIVLVGKPSSINTIERLNQKGLIKATRPDLGSEGFIIKTAADQGKNYLVLSGCEDAAVTYGVYSYLEKVRHCGFFEDGEYVPKYTKLVESNLDITDKPVFEQRWYPSYPGCAWSCSNHMWSDWVYLADYSAKKKINHMWISGANHTIRNYMKDIANQGRSYNTAPYVSYDMEEAKRLYKYIRTDLGLRVAYGTENILDTDGVNEEFRKLHPEFKYLPMKGTQWGNWYMIDPTTPEFVNYAASVVKNAIDILGADHEYVIAAIGGESMTLLDDPVRDKTIRGEWARGVLKGLKKADPQGIWHCEGYALGWPMYNEANTKDFLSGVDSDDFYVWDVYSEGNPLRFKRNFFDGKKWLLGYTSSLAGWNYMHGSLKETQESYQEVFKDPKAKRCAGGVFSPELQAKNQLYVDFLFKMFWNPNQVKIDDFLSDYALRRYGPASRLVMSKFAKKLVETVYGPSICVEHPFWTRNPIQLMLHSAYIGNLGVYKSERRAYVQRYKFIKPLREALELAVKEDKNQRGNPLYDIDLMDVGRQYIEDTVNYYVYEMYDAYEAGDKAKFEKSSKTIMDLMDSLSLLFSSNKEYDLATFADRVARRWKESGDDQSFGEGYALGQGVMSQSAGAAQDKLPFAEKVWVRVKGWGAPDEYLRGEYYQLNKYVYRPRMEFAISEMRKRILDEDKHIDFEKVFKPHFEAEFDKFLKSGPCPMTDEEVYKGSTADAVREILRTTKGLGPK
ncbi:MAG: alpha-N-acetylglucosaminidase TIM-barrel domain-containing protein [Armatimonadota bacterium]